MNVKELREVLADFPDDMEVILQKDAEGNWYSALSGGEYAWYVAETTWSGYTIHDDDYDPVDDSDAAKVAMLWPVN
ncbi:hypothetical protein ACFWPU_00735 [Streptomyces sp. NPDC058471]|uniref:hypothetical protein n=1 Tax=Streptomyces sp. NPDC058471 TaxID=3346516 RepID=UPI003659576C